MKKILFAIAFGALIVAACNKEQNTPDPIAQRVTLRAVGEAYTSQNITGATKGTLNDAGSFLWADGDQIGVRLYKGTAITGEDPGSGYGAWNGTFKLDDGYDGQTNGSFTCTTGLDEWVHWGYAAYYPMFDSNIGGDAKVYFHLQEIYDNYSSSTCLMPMLANMNIAPDGLEGRPSDINFKHVGAGIRVTLKDVPASANQASLTVAGKNIFGWYTVDDPSQAGTVAIEAGNGSNSTIYMKFPTAEAKRDITFIFPLPTVDLAGGITIKLYYGNSYTEFWSRSASNLPKLKRGDLLDMPDLTVSSDPGANVKLYVHPTTAVKNELCFKSSTLGTASWPGTPFTSYEIVAGSKYYTMEFPATSIWGKTITDLYVNDRDNWSAKDGGCTLTFSGNKMAYFIVATKNEDLVLLSKRPTEPSITIDGNFADWANVSGNSNTNSHENTVLMKAYSNGTDLFVYLKLTVKEGFPVDLSSGRYFRLYFNKDNDTTTGKSEWYREGAETIPAGIENFLVYFNHSGSVDNADIQGIGNDYSLKVVSNNSGASLEVELKVPLSVLGNLTADDAAAGAEESDEIGIYSLGYRGGDYSEFTGSVAGVMIPSAS